MQTCFACPEQYDAVLDGEVVGYLRLRHGVFRVHLDSPSGPEIYSATPAGDGIFEHDERARYLKKARKKIAKALGL